MMTNNKTIEEKLAVIAHKLSLAISRQEHSGLTIGDKRKLISEVYTMVADELVAKEVL